MLTCIHYFVPQNSNCELYKLPLPLKTTCSILKLAQTKLLLSTNSHYSITEQNEMRNLSNNPYIQYHNQMILYLLSVVSLCTPQ